MVHLKRAYEPEATGDGHRVLVERLWPRGLKKERAHLDEWLKDVAPSDALRKWFHHDPDRWTEFEARYLRELGTEAARAAIDGLVRRAEAGTVTLVYASRDERHNNAVVLKRLLESRLRRAARSPSRR
jgi:uncharacterized protein YeaO (DUF488 family)